MMVKGPQGPHPRAPGTRKSQIDENLCISDTLITQLTCIYQYFLHQPLSITGLYCLIALLIVQLIE